MVGAQITSAPGASRDGGKRSHAGWDLAGVKVGTPVFAEMDGTVVDYRDGGAKAGNMIVLKYSNGRTRRILHLAGRHEQFAPGTKFKAGDAIAFAGNTGNASTRGTNRAVVHMDGNAGPPMAIGAPGYSPKRRLR